MLPSLGRQLGAWRAGRRRPGLLRLYPALCSLCPELLPLFSVLSTVLLEEEPQGHPSLCDTQKVPALY